MLGGIIGPTKRHNRTAYISSKSVDEKMGTPLDDDDPRLPGLNERDTALTIDCQWFLSATGYEMDKTSVLVDPMNSLM